MENITTFFKNYKNAIFVFLACIVVTMTGLVFSKGEYYHYNYERQIIKDCDMGWYQPTDTICKDYKEKQKIIDDQELNAGAINIPLKSAYDYTISIASILQIVFLVMACFMIGAKYKSEKLINLWKCIPTLLVMIALCCLLNYLYILVNGTFTSNDLLRIIFEIGVAMSVIVLGRKL